MEVDTLEVLVAACPKTKGASALQAQAQTTGLR